MENPRGVRVVCESAWDTFVRGIGFTMLRSPLPSPQGEGEVAPALDKVILN